MSRNGADHDYQTVENSPSNIEAECALLGVCLVDSDTMGAIREIDIRPEDYQRETHRTLWAAMLDLSAGGKGLDVITLADRLNAQHENGGDWLVTLNSLRQKVFDGGITSVQAPYYGQIIKRVAGQRRLIQVAGQIAAMAHAHEGELDALYDKAAQEFLAAVNVSGRGSHLALTDDALMRYLETQSATAHRLQEDPEALIRVPWDGLDQILGDLVPGFTHVIAAESSIGKTMYLECVTEYNARRGHAVVFYHLELNHQYMIHRQMLRHAAKGSNLTMAQLRQGYHGAEVGRAIDAIREWSGNITYVHSPGWSAERIAVDAQRLYAQGMCDLVVVDYLQKLALPLGKGENAAMAIGRQVETLKNMAETLEVPVMIGSQINREGKQTRRRPTEANIRNSGEVAERSNQVVVLNRPTLREDQSAGATSEIIEAYVDKNTSGETGKAELIHLFGRYTLTDAEEERALAYETEPIPW